MRAFHIVNEKSFTMAKVKAIKWYNADDQPKIV